MYFKFGTGNWINSLFSWYHENKVMVNQLSKQNLNFNDSSQVYRWLIENLKSEKVSWSSFHIANNHCVVNTFLLSFFSIHLLIVNSVVDFIQNVFFLNLNIKNQQKDLFTIYLNMEKWSFDKLGKEEAQKLN